MTRLVLITAVGMTLSLTSAFIGAQGNASSVETAKVVSQALEKTVTIPGDLTPYLGVNLSARVSGFVESVPVDRGSWVKRGQLLAIISAPELLAQRAEGEAKLQAVRAQHAEAEAKM